MEDEPHLIGVGRAAGGPVARQLRLVQLDQVLGLAAGAVDRVIGSFGAAISQRGGDETDAEAEAARFDARDYATLGRTPSFRGIARVPVSRTSSRVVGAFSQRLMVGWLASPYASPGSLPSARFNLGS